MDELARLLPRLRRGNTYASCVVEDPPGYTIEPLANGACPFLMRTPTHALCAIHHLAPATGRDVAKVKPATCRHWPVSGRDQRDDPRRQESDAPIAHRPRVTCR
jgi:hypothetical protein